MATIYACTHIDKEVERDSYDDGCFGDRTCTMDESCNVEAPNAVALIDVLRRHYCLAMDDLWIPHDDDKVSVIGYNRLEDADGNEVDPDDDIYKQWKKGKAKLWLADYTFHIEKRETSDVPFDDFKDSGLKYHE